VNGYFEKTGCASRRVDASGCTIAATPSYQAAFNNCRRDMALSARS
jgi:hypothetical protein